jgi:type IV pilus assembly protein PilB
MTTNSRIGDLLLQQGLINETQLIDALDMQKTKKMKLGEILIENSVISEEVFLKALAGFFQLPIVDLDQITIDEKLLNSFPLDILEKHKVLPLSVNGRNLLVATSDPLNIAALQDIRYISGYQVKPVLCSLKQIALHLKNTYKSMDTLDDMRQDQGQSQETSIIKLVNSIFGKAIREGASDIHLEPQKDQLRVRFRIDGVLFKKLVVPHALYRKVISRVKILAGMDVAENRKPQDGRISWKEGTQHYDMRVSTLLDVHGEKITLRILNKQTVTHTFESLGFNTQEIDQIKTFIRRPYGILLVTGPTGAGKTTTLYSILHVLNQMSTNIITVEDPVEYQLDGITQTAINPHTGYSFANAIRHILRHDPNIIMVGEIRDVETAEVSVRAALTGHLVLATLHTNSAAGAVTRLLEMNIEPFLLSSTIIGAVAQRLVRRLCPHCKVEITAPSDIEKFIAKDLSKSGPFTIAIPKGCAKCHDTGYSGRVGLFEILKVNQKIRDLILNKANEQDINKCLVAQGMKTLRMAGFEKVLEKITSYEEVLRVTLTEDM